MWKKILIGFVVFIALLVTIVMYATSGLTETADKFFSALSANNYELAYNMLSEDFKKNVTKEELKEFAHKNGFDMYKKANWGNRQIDGTRGVLEGSIETVRGTVVPVTLKMIKDDYDNWKIYAIYKPKSGIVEEEPPPKPKTKPTNETKPTTQKPANINPIVNNTPINSVSSNTPSNTQNNVANNPKPKEMALPSANELKQMVKKSFDLFAMGVKEKNLEKLYNYASPIFRQEISLDGMNREFSRAFNYPAYFTQLLNLEPSVTKKEFIPEQKKLIIRGEYLAIPNKLVYKVTYIWNNGKWELIGINFDVNSTTNNANNTNNQTKPKTNNNSNININKEYINLVKDTIHNFALSVKEKSMQRVYQDTAEIFKEQISLEKLNELFKSFIEKNIDLTPLDNLEPIFDKEPKVDSNGILEIKGHYATSPSVVRFDLKYIKENGVWKILGLNIKVGK